MCVGDLIYIVSPIRYVNIQSVFWRHRSRTEFGLILSHPHMNNGFFFFLTIHFYFIIPKNGKFSRRPIFALFCGKSGTAKIEICEIFSKFDHLFITFIQNNNGVFNIHLCFNHRFS